MKKTVMLCLCFSPLAAWSESVQPRNVQVITVSSEALKASRPVTVLLPPAYPQSLTRHPVLYLLHGYSGNHEDWTTKTNLSTYAAAYPLIIVMPDGENSWYSNSATRPDYRYEDFIIKDLIPFVDAHYRSIAGRHARAVAGLSMGGFGAMKLGLKYPQLFSSVASFSGALAHAQPVALGHPNPAIKKSLEEAFGPPGNEAHVLNDPFAIACKLGAVKPAIYFDCGNGDSLLDYNRKFAELLASLKIPYEYREPGGAHTWEYWDRQIQEYLRLLAHLWRLPPAGRPWRDRGVRVPELPFIPAAPPAVSPPPPR